MDITYKKLGSKDSQIYRKIRLEALQIYPKYYGANYKEQVQLGKLFFEDIIEKDLSKGIMTGVFHKNDLIGICGLIFDENQFPLSGEIVQLYIKKRFQSRGLGKKLIEFIIDLSTKLKLSKISLIVHKNNLSAIKLYNSLGFKLEKSLEEADEDLYVLALTD